MSVLTRFLHWVVSYPWAYDWVQNRLGLRQHWPRIAPYLAQAADQIVLDVGAGTGNCISLLPQSATYLGLDISPKRLQGLKAKWPSVVAIVGDGTEICLKDKSVGYTLCFALLHHLSDIQLPLLLSELARVTRQRLILLDAVEYTESKTSNLLWKWDRGGHPRSVETLYTAIEQWFEIERLERYAIYHHYILCVGKPRRRT
jgi:ubiquinone/menaquinone biosynthesis C-methylase UbiE